VSLFGGTEFFFPSEVSTTLASGASSIAWSDPGNVTAFITGLKTFTGSGEFTGTMNPSHCLRCCRWCPRAIELAPLAVGGLGLLGVVLWRRRLLS